jgi:hypothetical protein
MSTTLVSVEEYLRTSYPDERNVGELGSGSLCLVGRPILAAAAFLGGQSRLKAGCGHNCPPHKPCQPKLTHYQIEHSDLLTRMVLYLAGRGYVHTAEAAREAKDGILRVAEPAIELPLHELFGK